MTRQEYHAHRNRQHVLLRADKETYALRAHVGAEQ